MSLLLLVGAAPPRHAKSHAAARREIIAIYFGTLGTDEESGMTAKVPAMKAAIQTQASQKNFDFRSLGVSLEPSVEDGIRDLALLGPFDQVSVGGNWSNEMVLRYLGARTDRKHAMIPQILLLERMVDMDGVSVGAERVRARYTGVKEISTWVDGGAAIPR